MFDDSHRARAWMLGPKAENSEEFERLLTAAIRDYFHWRRNFHPEDTSYVRAIDRLSADYQGYFEDLNARMFEMLSHLKMSVPFFSPRYLGHMNTDLLTPALLGYMIAMLYNQNNIVREAAPVTQRLETEAMKMIARMLMLPDCAWGHLCSGGSAANTEGLWIARQVALYPYQVALAALDMSADLADKVYNISVSNHTFADLVNTSSLRKMSVAETIQLADDMREFAGHYPEIGTAMESNSVSSLGLAVFADRARSLIGDNFPTTFNIVVSRNAHYSLKKSAGLLGLGNLIYIDLDEDFRMRSDQLREEVDRIHADHGKVVTVVGVYGSTEEGAIDDIDEFVGYRNDLCDNARGDFWLHADACYGGYALAMASPTPKVADVTSLMKSLVKDARDDVVTLNAIWSTERIKRWLDKSSALGSVDSIALDPHKLGYVPYSAGAVLLRDYRAREFVRCDAPYLNAGSSEASEEQAVIWDNAYLGRFTLEGSRPGAYGAAVWLSHATVPLDRSGHGRIVAESILSAEALRQALAERTTSANDAVELSCVPLGSQSDLNILCYSFHASIDSEPISLKQMNLAIGALYDQCLPSESAPTHTKDFVIAKTNLTVDEYLDTVPAIAAELGLRGHAFSSHEYQTLGNPWRDVDNLEVVRSVVMGPFLNHAGTRERFAGKERSLLSEYIEFLGKELPRILLDVTSAPLFCAAEGEKKPHLTGDILVVEDDPRTRADLVAALKGEYGFKESTEAGVVEVSCFSMGQEALRANEKLTAALVDVNLGENHPVGGLDLLKEASTHKRLKGAVIFTGGDGPSDIIRERVEELRHIRPDWQITIRKKPALIGENRRVFGAAINRVFEDLWDVQNSSVQRS